MYSPWSGSFGGENDGPLVADLTDEGTIPEDTFEKGTCRTVEQALEVARRIGYENGIMIKASEVCMLTTCGIVSNHSRLSSYLSST